MQLTAVVAAGDRRAARKVCGESKAFLELAGKPLVVHVVSTLQSVQEVSSVWVVGDLDRLARVFENAELRTSLRKPLVLLEQFEDLYQNAWQSYRRILPQAGPRGRDPLASDAALRVFYLSCDIPFVTPQEISDFLRRGMKTGAPYVAGLVAAETLAPFRTREPNVPGIDPSFFGVSEGRFRQNNLHLVQPALLPNRHYIEELYENRYQKNWREILRLAWRVFRSEEGSLALIFYFLLAHLALFADRIGWPWLARKIRSRISMRHYEMALSRMLRAEFRMVVTQIGGCGIDIDDENDLAAAQARYAEWRAQQAMLAEQLHGPAPLPLLTTPQAETPITLVRH